MPGSLIPNLAEGAYSIEAFNLGGGGGVGGGLINLICFPNGGQIGSGFL